LPGFLHRPFSIKKDLTVFGRRCWTAPADRAGARPAGTVACHNDVSWHSRRTNAVPVSQHPYRLVVGTDATRPPLILLHGSGQTEEDMLPLAARLSPESTAIAVRGAIPWQEGYAFFRRFADRSIDEASIRTQAPVLAEFLAGLGAQHRLRERPILIGFSNGAIMATAMICLYPDLAAGAVLLRPLSPFATPANTRLPGTLLLIIDGSNDDRRMPDDGGRLAEQMKQAGAAVTHHQLATGHAITEADCVLVREWLAAGF
jgi:phospholipase/carboxylesterase